MPPPPLFLFRSFTAPDGSTLVMRVGIVTGPATGGVVGASMLRYHLFGRVTQEVTCFEQAAPHGGTLVSAEFRDALLGPSAIHGLGQLDRGSVNLTEALDRGSVNLTEALSSAEDRDAPGGSARGVGGADLHPPGGSGGGRPSVHWRRGPPEEGEKEREEAEGEGEESGGAHFGGAEPGGSCAPGGSRASRGESCSGVEAGARQQVRLGGTHEGMQAMASAGASSVVARF